MTQHKIEESSGSVFADLELAEVQELETKAQLAHRIGEIIHGRHLNQTEAAEVLGATQPIVSRLMNGQLTRERGVGLVRRVSAHLACVGEQFRSGPVREPLERQARWPGH